MYLYFSSTTIDIYLILSKLFNDLFNVVKMIKRGVILSSELFDQTMKYLKHFQQIECLSDTTAYVQYQHHLF